MKLNWHIHKWEKWKVIKQGTIQRGDKDIGHFFLQERVCETCGKKEWENVTTETV